MEEKTYAGVYQLENGFWGYRYAITVNGKRKENKKVRNDEGKPFKTQKQAMKAREIAIHKEKEKMRKPQVEIQRRTVKEVFQEYCENGRKGKAYTTILKQDSLWKNHLKSRFGNKMIDEISVAEIQDYLEELYYEDNRAYSYVESFLKMFYLIFGQAYSRNYLATDVYNKLCINKDTKIHMPKMKIDEDTDIYSFNQEELDILEKHFIGSNAQIAYLLGRYCGLRISECYGLKWANIDLVEGTITIDRQMSYQNGIIKLVPVKTRNAKRKIYLGSRIKEHLIELKKQNQKYEKELYLQRQQNQTIIQDLDNQMVSSLELVNSLPNGKIQTVNSMKYHSRMLQSEKNVPFKYHYLRHTYGTSLAVLNTPMHILCNQMGHASSKVTEKYYLSVSLKGVDVLKANLECI